MTIKHLLIAIAVAALATLAIIPAITILRAPMPTLDAVTATAPCVPHYGVNACSNGHSIPEHVVTYAPWCVHHVTVAPSSPKPGYPSGPNVWFGYDGTKDAAGAPVIVDAVTTRFGKADARAQVMTDCTNSQADS